MSPAYEVKIMSPQELHDDVLPERERHASVVLSPPDDIAVRVGPQKVAQQPCSTFTTEKLSMSLGHVLYVKRKRDKFFCCSFIFSVYFFVSFFLILFIFTKEKDLHTQNIEVQ